MIVIFKEFPVVFAVISFVDNPVRLHKTLNIVSLKDGLELCVARLVPCFSLPQHEDSPKGGVEKDPGDGLDNGNVKVYLSPSELESGFTNPG